MVSVFRLCSRFYLHTLFVVVRLALGGEKVIAIDAEIRVFILLFFFLSGVSNHKPRSADYRSQTFRPLTVKWEIWPRITSLWYVSEKCIRLNNVNPKMCWIRWFEIGCVLLLWKFMLTVSSPEFNKPCS